MSEAAVTAIAKLKPEFTEQDLQNAAVNVPVGLAAQAAAIASLGHLGKTYGELRAAAKAALEALDYVESSPMLEAARRTALDSLPK